MLFKQVFWCFVGAKEGLDFTAERLVNATGLLKKLGALGHRLFESSREHFFNLFPLVLLHKDLDSRRTVLRLSQNRKIPPTGETVKSCTNPPTGRLGFQPQRGCVPKPRVAVLGYPG